MAGNEGLESEKNITSMFNDSQLGVFRLNDSWRLCKHYNRTGNLHGWSVELDNIWHELVGDSDKLTGSEDDDNNKYRKKNAELLKALKITLKIGKTNIIRNVIMKREEFLRKLQLDLGKGTQYKNKNEDEMEIE